MQSRHLIKGTLQPIILKLLEKNGRMYGYEITQRVRELTDGQVEITEGALYPALHKLESEGVLRTEKEYIGKRVRKYYSLTKTGKSVVKKRVRDMLEFLKTINALLEPKPSSS